MKKVRVHRRKGHKGWWCDWREGGRRKAKALPNKALADHFAKLKYAQLNSDVFTGIVNVDWSEMVEAYEVSKRVAGFEENSIYEALQTLKHFARLVGPLSSKQITQATVNRFILERGKEIKRYTLNKDISNLAAFIRWGQEPQQRYFGPDLQVKKVKVTPRDPRALSINQVRTLLASAGQRSACWRMRVFLLLVTGLRSGDVDKLTVADIDFEQNAVDTRSKKTRKHMPYRPLPPDVMPELTRYVAELPVGQARLLQGDSNTFKKWKVIRERAGLPTLRIHDLRVTFSAMVQEGVAAATVAQGLLEHSDVKVTLDHYTPASTKQKTDAAAVARLPVRKWLIPPIPRVPPSEPRKCPKVSG